jgi:hypothetical protein
VLACATGCPGGGGGGDDDEPPIDGNPMAGLTVAWDSKPETIPGDGPSNTRVERAVFRIANLRVVGDAGPLTVGAATLEWAAGTTPAALALADAPSGLYSRCVFDLSGAPYAYEITGTVRDGDTMTPFTIRDTQSTAIAVDYGVMLPPGGSAEVRIDVDIARLVGVVDFSQVPLQGGQYLVEDGSPQLVRVRDELDQTFDSED